MILVELEDGEIFSNLSMPQQAHYVALVSLRYLNDIAFKLLLAMCYFCDILSLLFSHEPRRERICLWGFRKSEFQTSLLSFTDWLEK